MDRGTVLLSMNLAVKPSVTLPMDRRTVPLSMDFFLIVWYDSHTLQKHMEVFTS